MNKQGVAGYWMELHKRRLFNYAIVGGDSAWVREQCRTLRAAGFEVVMRTRPNQFDIMRAILVLWKADW